MGPVNQEGPDHACNGGLASTEPRRLKEVVNEPHACFPRMTVTAAVMTSRSMMPSAGMPEARKALRSREIHQLLSCRRSGTSTSTPKHSTVSGGSPEDRPIANPVLKALCTMCFRCMRLSRTSRKTTAKPKTMKKAISDTGHLVQFIGRVPRRRNSRSLWNGIVELHQHPHVTRGYSAHVAELPTTNRPVVDVVFKEDGHIVLKGNGHRVHGRRGSRVLVQATAL